MQLGEVVQNVDRYYASLAALPKAQTRLRCLQEELQRLVWRQPPKVRVAKYYGMPGFTGDSDVMCGLVIGSDLAYEDYKKEAGIIRNKLYIQAGIIRETKTFIAEFERSLYSLPMKDEHIIRLRHKDRWTTVALGELLGMTHQGVSMRYTTAMSRLGLLLEGNEVLVAINN